jgi:hypothetical protein
VIVSEASVLVELRMMCEPSEPLTTVAETPGLLLDLLMAEAIALRLSFDDVTSSDIDLLPTALVNVPVPSPAACELLNVRRTALLPRDLRVSITTKG